MYSDYFEVKTRTNGKEYVVVKEKAHELKELCKAIHMGHFDVLPNDWVYNTIFEAFSDLEENKGYEYQDLITTDIYNNDLFQWLQDLPGAYAFCDEAISDGLCDGSNLITTIQMGQYLAKSRIYEEVREFLVSKWLLIEA